MKSNVNGTLVFRLTALKDKLSGKVPTKFGDQTYTVLTVVRQVKP